MPNSKKMQADVRARGFTLFFYLELQTDVSGAAFIFSGTARWRDKLIFGAEDVLSNGIAAAELRECVGEFELFIAGAAGAELSADYFGMGKWYYYKPDCGADGLFAAMTSYNLLLALKSLGVKLRLNTKRVVAGMGFFGTIAESNFTKQMEMENCYAMLPDKRIAIRSGATLVFGFEKTGLFKQISEPEPYSEEAYEKCLYETRDEIASNVRAVLEHPPVPHRSVRPDRRARQQIGFGGGHKPAAQADAENPHFFV